MNAPQVTDIKVLRGTKGRVTGWVWHCTEHGLAPQPEANKRTAERGAIEHAREPHLHEPRILTRKPR